MPAEISNLGSFSSVLDGLSLPSLDFPDLELSGAGGDSYSEDSRIGRTSESLKGPTSGFFPFSGDLRGESEALPIDFLEGEIEAVIR
mmetsp:Transcript_1536/g.3281  ORF Transcript_1536/g.3281 Transcript_1536/m.3281 type:complete len:87 (+) Transcript_1536:1489-1749(+)